MKIIVNGREYESIDKMPPEVRRQYQELIGKLGKDADGDGLSDVFQSPGSYNVAVEESITYNGKTYKSRAELPLEARELIERLPELKPDEKKTLLDIKTTKAFSPSVSVSARWGSDAETLQSAQYRFSFQMFLIALLVAAVLFLLYLWLSGIRPSQLWD